MPKVNTRDGLTPKQRTFAHAIVTGETLTGAARQAGYQHPEVIGRRLMKNPAVQQTITSVLDRHGLDDDYLARKTLELCEASDEDGPNWTARGRGLELLTRVRGHLKQTVDVNIQTFEQRAVLVADMRENPALALEILERLAAQRKVE
jgi:hypothetical protein